MADQSDADYAAAVLEGRVPTAGPWHSRRPPKDSTKRINARSEGASRRVEPQVGGGAGGSSSVGTGSGTKRSRHEHGRPRQQQHQTERVQQRQNVQQQGQHRQRRQPRPHQSQDCAAQGTPVPARNSAHSSASSGLEDHNHPGPRSTGRVAHCTACDVFVPCRPGDWEVHVAGIRHRRQLLSLRTFGERNRLVLSAFESAPDSAEAAHRLVGARAAHDFGLLPTASSLVVAAGAGGSRRPSEELLGAARRLNVEALKQLLCMFGVGQIYNTAAAVFAQQQLAAALQHAAQQLEQQAGVASGSSSGGGGGGVHLGCSSWSVATGTELAGLVHVALTGRLNAAELSISLAPALADAPRSEHAALAAALPLLLNALHRSANLTTLRLSLPRPGNADARRIAELWQQAWQHTLPALRGLLESSAPMRTLHLALPDCLHGATAAYMPQLQAAAAAAPVTVRSQVLLALHPRAGRCSLLQLLPLGVLREVLDLAAPLQPCSVRVAAAGAAVGAAGG